MHLARPLVSVVIPSFNASATLGEAIASAINQTERRLEVIVADDGSSDDSIAVARSLANDKVSVSVLMLAHCGVSRARNTAVAAARGEFVAFLDADDYWDPPKVERQLAAFDSSDDIAVVGHLMRYEPLDSRRVLGVFGELVGDREMQMIAEGRLVPFALSSSMIKRELILREGGFDEELSLAEDLDFFQRMASYGRFVTIPETLGAYRIHAASVSAREFSDRELLARFVSDRVAAKGQGFTLSLEEYQASSHLGLIERYHELGAKLYRKAGENVADRHWITAGLCMIGALLISPLRTWKRFRKQRQRKEGLSE